MSEIDELQVCDMVVESWQLDTTAHLWLVKWASVMDTTANSWKAKWVSVVDMTAHLWQVKRGSYSLVPRPHGRREKWPGIHC